jgi:hypothetical protein
MENNKPVVKESLTTAPMTPAERAAAIDDILRYISPRSIHAYMRKAIGAYGASERRWALEEAITYIENEANPDGDADVWRALYRVVNELKDRLARDEVARQTGGDSE